MGLKLRPQTVPTIFAEIVILLFAIGLFWNGFLLNRSIEATEKCIEHLKANQEFLTDNNKFLEDNQKLIESNKKRLEYNRGYIERNNALLRKYVR